MTKTETQADSDRVSVSRRGFLKGALAGAGLLSVGSYEAVAQMVGGSSVRGWGVPPGLVRIDSNENAVGPSPRAVEAIIGMVYNINRYGQNSDLLGQLARRHDLPVVEWTDSPFKPVKDPWISVGAGSSELLYAIGHTYLKAGIEAIEISPGFGFVTRLADQFGAKSVGVPVLDGFKPDLAGIRSAITDRTGFIVVTTPGNPSGHLTPTSELKAFIDSIPPRIMVLVDEAYIDFAENEADQVGAAPLIKDYPNVIVTRTFSKLFGMAGMRVGYAMAQPEVISKINVHKANTLTMLSTHAASAALGDYEHMGHSREIVTNGKQYFYDQLSTMGVEYLRSESSFVMINIKGNSDDIADKLNKEYNVLVGNANARWGIQGWLRITAGLPEENEAFVSALKKVLVSS